MSAGWLVTVGKELQIQSDLKHLTESTPIDRTLLERCLVLDRAWSAVPLAIPENARFPPVPNAFRSATEKLMDMTSIVVRPSEPQQRWQCYLDVLQAADPALFDYGWAKVLLRFADTVGMQTDGQADWEELVQRLGEMPNEPGRYYLHRKWGHAVADVYDRARKLFRTFHEHVKDVAMVQPHWMWTVVQPHWMWTDSRVWTSLKHDTKHVLTHLTRAACPLAELVPPWVPQAWRQPSSSSSCIEAHPHAYNKLLEAGLFEEYPWVLQRDGVLTWLEQNLANLSPGRQNVVCRWVDERDHPRLLRRVACLVKAHAQDDDNENGGWIVLLKQCVLFCQQDMDQWLVDHDADERWLSRLHACRMALEPFQPYLTFWSRWLSRHGWFDKHIDGATNDPLLIILELRLSLVSSAAPIQRSYQMSDGTTATGGTCGSGPFDPQVLTHVVDPLLWYRIDTVKHHRYLFAWLKAACALQRLLVCPSTIDDWKQWATAICEIQWLWVRFDARASKRAYERPIPFPTLDDNNPNNNNGALKKQFSRIHAWTTSVQRWSTHVLQTAYPHLSISLRHYARLSVPWLSAGGECAWPTDLALTSLPPLEAGLQWRPVSEYLDEWLHHGVDMPSLTMAAPPPPLHLDSSDAPHPSSPLLTSLEVVPEEIDDDSSAPFPTVVLPFPAVIHSFEYRTAFYHVLHKLRDWRQRHPLSCPPPSTIPPYAFDPRVHDHWNKLMS